MSNKHHQKSVVKAQAGKVVVQNKGYSFAGASHQRRAFKGFVARSGSPREDIDWNNYTLRQRARILTMSAPIAKAAITTNRTNVIGVGLKLKSKVYREVLGWTAEQAAEWQKKTEFEFSMWAGNKKACDAAGVNDFYAQQQLAFSSWLTSGDCFGIPKHYPVTPMLPYSLRIMVVEADRVRTPNMTSIFYTDGRNSENGNPIYDGVEVDKETGAVVAYWISNKYPYELKPNAEPEKFTRVEAYGKQTELPQVLHVMDSERADQYRGVSYLAPVIEPLLQLNRYTDAELTAADIEASYCAWVKSQTPQENPFSNIESNEGSIEKNEDEYEIAPGMINFLGLNEDIVFSDPKRPASGYSLFVEAVATQIGAALEISKEILLKVFNSSYSASRGALLEAWKGFKMRRQWFISDWCNPIYELWLTEAVARGRISAPGFFNNASLHAAYLGCEWIGPAQGTLNPVQEIQAEVLAFEHGLSTRADAAIRLNGSEFSDNVSELGVETRQMQTAGISTEEETNA